MVKNLSILQAYCVVLDYLDKYYFKTYSNDIGDLVGDMHFLQDGRPVDDAAWEDWLDAVSKKGKPEVNVHQSAGISLTIDEAYAAMINFLEGYVYRTNSEETRKLLDEKIAFKDGKPIDQENWGEWLCSVEKILAQDPLILPPFTLLNE